MANVVIAFMTGVFVHRTLRCNHWNLTAPRTRPSGRVVYCELIADCGRTDSREAFHYGHYFAGTSPPPPFVKVLCLNDQRVAFPMAT